MRARTLVCLRIERTIVFIRAGAALLYDPEQKRTQPKQSLHTEQNAQRKDTPLFQETLKIETILDLHENIVRDRPRPQRIKGGRKCALLVEHAVRNTATPESFTSAPVSHSSGTTNTTATAGGG